MKAAMVVHWTQTRLGREAGAIRYAREVDEFWGKQAAEGKCTEPKWYWSMSGRNLWIVEGEDETLLGLAADPQARRLQIQGGVFTEDFGWEICPVGREEMLQPMEATLKDLGVV